jgi:DNA polymerase III epsilon subunit-like protein
MRILVFDTETTGLPKSRTLDDTNLHLWPYIVQFSYVVYDISSNRIVKMVDELVKLPEKIIIPTECIKIHGITNAMCESRGKNIENLLIDFYDDFNECERIIAHNLSFDLNLLKAELLRVINKSISKNGTDIVLYNNMFSNLTTSKKYYCTMQDTIDYCQVKALDRNGKEFVKFPKLSELYHKMFGNIPNNLHNSMNDVIICLRCYVMWYHKYDVAKENSEIEVFITSHLK